MTLNQILIFPASAKKYAILRAFRRQYFIQSLNILVNGEVVVLIAKGRTVKIVEYIDKMVPLSKSSLNKKYWIPSKQFWTFFQSSGFILSLQRWIFSYLRPMSLFFSLVCTYSGFTTLVFLQNSFIVSAFNICLIHSSSGSEFLKSK